LSARLSEKGGVYKSIDGGRTWNKLTNGLPELMGRIGIRVAPSNLNVVYPAKAKRKGTSVFFQVPSSLRLCAFAGRNYSSSR